MGGASTQLNRFSMAAGNCTQFLCRITGSYYGGGSLPSSKNYVNHQGRHQVWRVPPGIFWTFFRAFLRLSHCFHWQFCFFFFLQSPRLHWIFNPQPSYQTYKQTYRSHLDILDWVPSISEVGWDPVLRSCHHFTGLVCITVRGAALQWDGENKRLPWTCGNVDRLGGISLEKLFVINYSNNFKRLVWKSLSCTHTHTVTHIFCVPQEPDIIQTFFEHDANCSTCFLKWSRLPFTVNFLPFNSTLDEYMTNMWMSHD